MSRRNIRDKWAAAVLASDLNNATKVVMWSLYRHMDENGRVQHRRDDLAEECGLANARRVSDRIKEARDAGFLTARAGGVNGQVVQYYADLPGSQRQGPSSKGRGGGLQGPSNRDPQTGVMYPSGSPRQGPIRVRATKQNREQEPAPDGGRGPGPHHEPKNGSDDEVPTTTAPVVTDRLSVPTAQQQADDVRANFEARGRALRLAVLGQEAAS